MYFTALHEYNHILFMNWKILIFLLSSVIAVDSLLSIATNPLSLIGFTSFGDILLNVISHSCIVCIDWIHVV